MVRPTTSHRTGSWPRSRRNNLVATGSRAWIVVSGGKGSDGVISEAAAMARYLAEKSHVPADAVLLEDASTNTRENLENSLQLLADQGISSTQMVVVTNNFHVLRSASLSRELGIPGAIVVGSPTAWYYLPVGLPAGVRRNRGALPQTESDHLCRHLRVVVGRGGRCSDHQCARRIRRRPECAACCAGIRAELRLTRTRVPKTLRRKRLFRRSCRSLAHVTHNTAML